MTSLVDFMRGMAGGAQNGAFATRSGGFGTHPGSEHAAGSLMNIPGLREALMQQQMAAMQQPQAPQQPQGMPMQQFGGQPGGNSLAAYMRGNLPLTRMMFG